MTPLAMCCAGSALHWWLGRLWRRQRRLRKHRRAVRSRRRFQQSLQDVPFGATWRQSLGSLVAWRHGTQSGSVEGFAYSPGFKTTDLVWDDAKMDQFIANPNSLFPGSNMATFARLSNAGDRKAIIEYLKTLN